MILQRHHFDKVLWIVSKLKIHIQQNLQSTTMNFWHKYILTISDIKKTSESKKYDITKPIINKMSQILKPFEMWYPTDILWFNH